MIHNTKIILCSSVRQTFDMPWITWSWPQIWQFLITSHWIMLWWNSTIFQQLFFQSQRKKYYSYLCVTCVIISLVILSQAHISMWINKLSHFYLIALHIKMKKWPTEIDCGVVYIHMNWYCERAHASLYKRKTNDRSSI